MTNHVFVVARGMRRINAAAYVGVSPTKFDEWVRDGRMPAGRAVDGCVLWDARALDEAFEALLYGPHAPQARRLREPQI